VDEASVANLIDPILEEKHVILVEITIQIYHGKKQRAALQNVLAKDMAKRKRMGHLIRERTFIYNYILQQVEGQASLLLAFSRMRPNNNIRGEYK